MWWCTVDHKLPFLDSKALSAFLRLAELAAALPPHPVHAHDFCIVTNNSSTLMSVLTK